MKKTLFALLCAASACAFANSTQTAAQKPAAAKPVAAKAAPSKTPSVVVRAKRMSAAQKAAFDKQSRQAGGR